MKRLRALSGLDAAFLYLEAAGTPMHVGSLMLLHAPRKRGYDFHAALCRLIEERLPKARVLRRRLIEAPLNLAHPMWQEGAELDLTEHVLRVRLRRPASLNTLLAQVAAHHAVMLPRERPLWQLVVFEGLADGRLALYSKLHHALLDGQGGSALAQLLLDVDARIPGASPAPRPGKTSAEQSTPSGRTRTAARATIGQFAKLFRALPATLKLAGKALGDASHSIGQLRESVLIAPRTDYNASIGPARSYAVLSLPILRVKRVAKAFGVSLNDVVMALVAYALRADLKRRKQLPEQALVVAMPVSLRAAGDGEANNQVSMAQCPLPTHIADPVERLRAIATATGQIKSRVQAFRHLIPTDFPGLAAPIWASGLSRLWARGRVSEHLPPLANLVVSNVPGPPIELYLAGAKLLHSYPVSIVTHGLALNITLQSYHLNLDFGLIADAQILPRPETLARALGKALDELEARMPA